MDLMFFSSMWVFLWGKSNTLIECLREGLTDLLVLEETFFDTNENLLFEGNGLYNYCAYFDF